VRSGRRLTPRCWSSCASTPGRCPYLQPCQQPAAGTFWLSAGTVSGPGGTRWRQPPSPSPSSPAAGPPDAPRSPGRGAVAGDAGDAHRRASPGDNLRVRRRR
jgi:hypothetical protein